MGCWNGTCAVSQMHITYGTKVAVFLLLESQTRGEGSYCYPNALYDLCPVPFYGEYNDYGAVENCHGYALNMVIDALKDQIYEFGQGPNSCHDIPVNRDNFDIDKLFEADGEGRLGIHKSFSWSDDEYDYNSLKRVESESKLTASQLFELDRLATKIKKVDDFRRVTHVIIHGDVFDDIMNKWYIEEYVGNQQGNKGYDNNYIHLYFRDILDDLPSFIQKLKSVKEKTPTMYGAFLESTRGYSFDTPNRVARMMMSLRNGESFKFGLIQVNEVINDYEDKGDWEGLSEFLKEVLTTLWVNSFMHYTRKLWSKQSGAGSQNNDHIAYRILTQSMNDIMDAEVAESEGED